MGRSPKSSSHRHSSSNQKNKRRRDSSSSDSDHDRQRHQRRNRDDERSYSNKTNSDPRIKQEPMTDDDSRRRQRPPNKSFESRRNPREQNEKSYQWGKQTDREKQKEESVEKEQPNFGLSGALLKDTNTYKGVVIKYSEPIEARKPKRRWRFYVFKGEQVKSIFLYKNIQFILFFCFFFNRNYQCIKFIVNQHI